MIINKEKSVSEICAAHPIGKETIKRGLYKLGYRFSNKKIYVKNHSKMSNCKLVIK